MEGAPSFLDDKTWMRPCIRRGPFLVCTNTAGSVEKKSLVWVQEHPIDDNKNNNKSNGLHLSIDGSFSWCLSIKKMAATDGNPTYSRAEWGSLSIQDRIRAMADADAATSQGAGGEENPIPIQLEGTIAHPIQVDLDAATEQVPIPAEEAYRSTQTKRSSVIDMWRKREGAAIASSANSRMATPPRKSFNSNSRNSSPSIQEKVASVSDVYEEKKETTQEEETTTRPASSPKQMPRNVTPTKQTPPPQDSGHVTGENENDTQSADAAFTGFGKTNSAIVNSWKQKETASTPGTLGAASVEAIPSESPHPKPPSRSNSGTRPRGSVLNRWNNREQQTPTQSNSSSPHRPNSPAVSLGDGPPQPTPDSPAFKDLKSRWTKFGDGGNAGSGNGPTPSPATTPSKIARSPSPRTTMEKKWQHSRQSFRQSPVTVNGESSVDGGIATQSLQQPTLDVDNDGFPKDSGSASTTPRNHLKKMGQLHAGRPKQTLATSKASSYLYTKPASTSSPSPVEPPSVSNNPRVNLSARPSPRKFAQRKQMLEKHRRRHAVDEESPEPIENSNSNEKSTHTGHSRGEYTSLSDALSQAFDDVVTEEEEQKLSDTFSRSNVRPANRFGSSPKVTAQALSAIATEERNSGNPDPPTGKAFAGYSEYSSLRVSDSASCNASEISKRPSNFAGPSDASADEQQSFASKSSIASRAHQTLRDKRKKNRDFGMTSSPGAMHSYGNTQRNQPYAASKQYSRLSDFNNYSIDPPVTFVEDEQFPQDENAKNAHTPTARAGNGKRKSSQRAYSSPTACGDGELPFDSDLVSTASNLISTVTSSDAYSSGPLVPAEQIVSDRFVSESNANVDAFATSLQAMSLGQIANDLTEEVTSTVLHGVDFSKISSDLNSGMSAASQSLNKNMNMASASLNKLVGSNVFPVKKRPTMQRSPSPVEEMAIEVEYVED